MTLEQMVEQLQEEHDLGVGMDLMRFVLPDGTVCEPIGKFEQVTGCPSTVTIAIAPAGPRRSS